MITNTVYINASDVAAAIGENPYCNPQEIFNKYNTPKLEFETEGFATESKSESRKIVEELGTKQDQEELEVILKQPTRDKVKEASIVKKTIEKSLEKAVTSKSLEKIETEETSVINAVKKISPVIDSKNITGYVNKERGIRAEEEILNTHEIKHDKKISSRNDRVRYLRFGNILVGGKTDGISDSELIEVKNRRRRFLGFPKYEQIQCEIYLRMTGCTKGTHVEKFQDKTRETTFYKNDALYQQIEKGLYKFYKDWYEITSSNDV